MTYLNRVITCIIILAIALTIIDYNNIDLKFQSLFFIGDTKNWFINRDDSLLKFIFYKLPKYLIVSYGVILIFWLSILSVYKQQLDLQKKLLFLILALITIPLVVAMLKHYSPIYCPNHINNFSGGHIYISPLKIFSEEIFFNNNGKCFPAGHASGGFALISLYFVMPTKRLKYYALSFSLLLGWIMGLYQIAKGAHYLSDTLVTLAIAYLISISLKSLLLKNTP